MINISYADFIGKLGLENTPPGGMDTIATWIEEANITNSSWLLDLACSTGYSSRNIAKTTQASGVGIDLSEISITAARNIAAYENLMGLEYIACDASSLPFESNFFTHVIAGSTFGFFQEREKVLDEVHRVLRINGLLCISSFFFKKRPPSSMLKEVSECIGYTPDPKRDFNYWRSFFETRFCIQHQEFLTLPTLSPQELNDLTRMKLQTCYSKIDVNEYDTIYKKLFKIRQTLNKFNDYQDIAIWIFKK